MFDVWNWYWLAEDGRVFASARQVIVDDDDDAYLAWLAAGHVATPWPRDDAGEQTDAAMQDVLRPYGLWVGLDALKIGLKAAIDVAAEAERMKYITAGAGQAMTYARKVEQARAAQADADPHPGDYPLLDASVGIDGDDVLDVAATVLTMDAAWEQIGAAIEAARLNAKQAINEAETAGAARAVTPVWPQV